ARDRLTAHSTDAVCAGCHKLTDPIGLALENFDGAGQFRLTENQAPIDPGGTLDGQPFKDVAGLGKAMHDHPGLSSCLTSRWYTYAIGRQDQTSDRPWLTYITRRFSAHGDRVPQLLREIATSRAFYAVSAPSLDGDAHTLLTSTTTAVN